MKKRYACHGLRRWAVGCILTVAVLSCLLPSCRHKAVTRHGDEAYFEQVDSLLKGINDVDSLQDMVNNYKNVQDVTGEMLAYKYLGTALRRQSCYEEAIQAHTECLKIATSVNDTLVMIAALNSIGRDYHHSGNLSDANGHFYRALALSNMCSDQESHEAIENKAKAQKGIGTIEIVVCHNVAADSIFHLVLNGETELNDLLGMASSCAKIGEVKLALGQVDSAWHYHRKALEYNRSCGFEVGEALCHLYFGRLYEQERSFTRAKQEYKQAYEKLRQLGESYDWLEASLSLSAVSLLLGEHEEARFYLQEAENEACRINSKEHQARAFKLHFDLSLVDGNAQQALEYHLKSEAMYDSIYGLEKSDEMRSQRIAYQNELKNWKEKALNSDISRLKRVRNLMGIMILSLFLMGAAIIAVFLYAMRVRSRTQRMLRQVEETRSLFFTNVVHQLRTPLTAIMGATDGIIADGENTDETERLKNVETIERQGRNLLTLVDRILEVGSVRSAIREPEWRTGDAVTFVRMVVESYRERCAERHIELTYMPRESDVNIDIVPQYLKTILDSLLDNAINYSSDFSHITVTSQVEKHHFVIKVSDDGMGISEADLPHVFEPFFRGAMAEHLIEGVGIGLTVARDMTMALRGTVSAESVKGQGSTFVVSLPCKHGKNVKERWEQVVEPAISLVGRRKKPQEQANEIVPEDESLPLALIVEDHADVAHQVGRALKGMCVVQYASDGEQALAKMQNQLPDLIITDVKMPVMDGHELCRRIRASQRLRSIPVIMISARTAEADRVLGIKAGADAYLVKPFVRDELCAWVCRLLESRKVWRADCCRVYPETSEPIVTTSVAPDHTVDMDVDFLDKFRQQVNQQMSVGEKLDLDKIALSFKMGESQLKLAIQELTGKSMTAYLNQLRMERAMQLLKERPDLLIGDVAEQCGFADVAYFSRVFRQFYGMTPTQARNSEFESA